MKKIININLSGRVIPIEDSAYEKLQGYIESLRRYFSKEEGRDEIINDIESRIAELMNEKVRKSESAITDQDINEIIMSMGRVEDFDEIISEVPPTPGVTSEQSYQGYTKQKKTRLYRDASDKLLGGVCSGIANYMNVDPAIVRLLFAIIALGAFGMGILVYIALWIFLPVRELDVYVGKRLFRNPDDRVISGVAGGLAAYFNKPSWAIRLVFAAPLIINILFGILNGIFFAFERDIFPNIFIGSFTGTFTLAYIILWIVLPEARSPFEKMEMRGEKVDVNRIRQNVKEGMSDVKGRMETFGTEVKSSAQDLGNRAKDFASTRGKAFADEVSDVARPAGRGCLHVIGVLFKAFFIFIIGSIALSLFVALMVVIFGGVAWWPINDYLWTSPMQKLTAWGTLIFFMGIPIIALMTWLIRRLARVRSRNRYLGWIFGGLWTIGWISVVMFASSIARDLREYDRSSTEVTLNQPPNGKLIVNVFEPEIRYNRAVGFMDMDGKGWSIEGDSMKYNNVKVRIVRSEDSMYHARIYKYSAGKNIQDAQERASQTGFNIFSRDSILDIGSGLSIHSDSKFRGQGVILEIHVPVNKKISFDESITYAYNPWVVRRYDRDNNRWNNSYRYRIDWDHDEYFDYKTNVDYTMSENGRLVDPNKSTTNDQRRDGQDYRYDENNENDSIRKIRLQEELRILEEKEKKVRTIKTISSTKQESIDDDNEHMSATRSPVFSLVNIFN